MPRPPAIQHVKDALGGVTGHVVQRFSRDPGNVWCQQGVRSAAQRVIGGERLSLKDINSPVTQAWAVVWPRPAAFSISGLTY